MTKRTFTSTDGKPFTVTLPEPLAGQRFNSALEQRVKLFQSNAGLEADGVVGVQTLLRLNERAGVDARAIDLRRQLSGSP